jgi:hypothetical protein
MLRASSTYSIHGKNDKTIFLGKSYVKTPLGRRMPEMAEN